MFILSFQFLCRTEFKEFLFIHLPDFIKLEFSFNIYSDILMITRMKMDRDKIVDFDNKIDIIRLMF